LEFKVAGYGKLENFLTTILKLTFETTLNSTPPSNMCFKHQTLPAGICSQVDISIKVGTEIVWQK